MDDKSVAKDILKILIRKSNESKEYWANLLEEIFEEIHITQSLSVLENKVEIPTVKDRAAQTREQPIDDKECQARANQVSVRFTTTKENIMQSMRQPASKVYRTIQHKQIPTDREQLELQKNHLSIRLVTSSFPFFNCEDDFLTKERRVMQLRIQQSNNDTTTTSTMKSLQMFERVESPINKRRKLKHKTPKITDMNKEMKGNRMEAFRNYELHMAVRPVNEFPGEDEHLEIAKQMLRESRIEWVNKLLPWETKMDKLNLACKKKESVEYIEDFLNVSPSLSVKNTNVTRMTPEASRIATYNRLVPFNRAHLWPESFENIKEAVQHGKLSGDGINTEKCSVWFRKKFNYDQMLFTPSCTAALEMAALLLDLQEGDQVIVPSFTFVSCANAFALRGATLVFADASTETPNISVDDILGKVNVRTKAIVVVHYAGIPVDVTRLKRETGNVIPIVEDCAHAIGSIDDTTNDFIGKLGVLATFSFHETKNIGIGEGGALVVNDPKLWRKAQIIREKGTNRVDFVKGRSDFYTWLSLGSSYLLSEVDAAVLYGALVHFEETQKKRLRIWDRYNEKLLPNSLYEKPNPLITRATAHMYYLKFVDPEQLQAFHETMRSLGLFTATHYVPLDQSPFVRKRDWASYKANPNPCIEAAKWSTRLVRLPLYYSLSENQICEVVEAINNYAKSNGLVLLHATTDEIWEEIRQLRNFHHMSFGQTGIIDRPTHWRFMKNHYQNYRVAYQSARFVGFIGHVSNDLRLACSAQGQGIARFMLTEFSKEYPSLDVKVKKDNAPSRRFFEKMNIKVELID